MSMLLLRKDNISSLLRPLSIPLIGEGCAMLLCTFPSMHFHDGTALPMLWCALLTILCGVLLQISVPRQKHQPEQRISYLIVTMLWIVLTLFATLPFLATGATTHFTNASFEVMSGITSTGATIFAEIEALPASIIFWRSVLQWTGGYGIVLLVLAVVPTLGINKYSLYTAETSGADNTGKVTTNIQVAIRQTLTVYVSLTLFFILLLIVVGMEPWDAVNISFCSISTGGFSPYGSSITSFTPAQQYVMAAEMLLGGINFMLLYNVFTFRFNDIRGKLGQLRTYLLIILTAIVFVVCGLHWRNGIEWHDAVRYGVLQTISAGTTTGFLIDDTELWWPPILFLFVVISLCGGMAGSTSGGLKTMRVIILIRNVRSMLRNRLHPYAVNPVRLNGRPVSEELVNNVMVIFLVLLLSVVVGVCLLMFCGVPPTESVGAVTGCITSYGPGLGLCGGMGNYAFMPVAAKWVLFVIMLLGRLECLTLLVIFLPGFWRK